MTKGRPTRPHDQGQAHLAITVDVWELLQSYSCDCHDDWAMDMSVLFQVGRTMYSVQ